MPNNIPTTNKEIFEGYERLPKEVQSDIDSEENLVDWDSQIDKRNIKDFQK